MSAAASTVRPADGVGPLPAQDVILLASGLTMQFGGLRAVDNVSLQVQRGEIVGLIGPNGAGKTTTFQMLTGFLRPSAGTVHFLGRQIERMSPVAICRLGLARTFQIVEVFPSLTVLEALTAAALVRVPMRAARDVAETTAGAVGLRAKRHMLCGNLTLPDQKALEIGKAVATRPQIVLLDEVMAGLRPAEAEVVVALIRRLRSEGITFLLVEHIMDVVMAISDRIIVLSAGRKIAEGSPDDVVSDPTVIDVYLGSEIGLA